LQFSLLSAFLTLKTGALLEFIANCTLLAIKV
jgi:hypothetical protein